MTATCEKLHAFADGELPADEVPAFERHLVICASCQTELQDVMLLEALGQGMEVSPEAPVAPAGRWRGRVVRWVSGGLAAAAVVAVLFSFARSDPFGPLLAEGRPFAARLAHPAAVRHRPVRALGGVSAWAPPTRARDPHELAAASLLAGDVARAAAWFASAPHTPSADNDRAVLAMLERRWADARVLLEAVLAVEPRSGPARWNLALVDEQLGRAAEAAAAFDEVARLDEAGWAEEARQRALALRSSLSR